MAKVMECPDCGSVMECIDWYFGDDIGGEAGTGDFECRNCDYVANNERKPVYRVDGYDSEVFEGVPEDMPFDEFMEQNS